MASKRKRNLKRGTFVEEKAKPHRRGVILGAFQDEGKKHTWNVEFEQPDGSKAKEVKTSRQLIAKDAPSTVDVPAVAVPAAEAAPVTIVEEASANLSGSESSKDDSSEAPTPPPTPPPSDSSVHSTNVARANPNITGLPSYDWTMHEIDDSPDHASLKSSSSDSNSTVAVETVEDEDEVDEDGEEDENERPDEGNMEDVLPNDANDLESEDEHKRKQELYLQEKAELLENGWTEIMESKRPPLAPDVRVQTKGKKNQRNGIIIRKVEKKVWLVQFDDSDQPEEISPYSLVQIFEPKKYKWTLVENSEPDEPIEEYADVGLVVVGRKLAGADDTSQ
ncbi:hypothetical protein SEMRO_377_G129900.1 [Seminavis robusta]|uniref:Uncharacterized protein n=1 Tax=Seminavis robusta TaxID=568900 RepID=A0A9N8DUB1_9STRA|nr:hypothetical protein SEMRO_377_G129900.1 [Seminavis robusta]|eukprot:Sro377_g129900.1 n/a (335) ;mRNA; r:4092-5182